MAQGAGNNIAQRVAPNRSCIVRRSASLALRARPSKAARQGPLARFDDDIGAEIASLVAEGLVGDDERASRPQELGNAFAYLLGKLNALQRLGRARGGY